MTDFTTTKIRCHAIGQIMTEPRGKTNKELYIETQQCLVEEEEKLSNTPPTQKVRMQQRTDKVQKVKAQLSELEAIKDEIVLSDTCKSYLVQSYVLSKYGRVREIQTKQMIKGTLSEDESIQLFAALEKRPFAKNTNRLGNDFITGTPDLFDGTELTNSNEIIDIKSCWDIFTFLSNVADPENKMYYWQMQGYLALTGAKIGTIAYCLVNTPDSIIEGEKYNLLRRMDVATEEDPDYKREVNLLIANRKFDDIGIAERLLTFSFERNDDDIEKIYQKVEKCRIFLSEFEQQHLLFSKSYRKSIQNT